MSQLRVYNPPPFFIVALPPCWASGNRRVILRGKMTENRFDINLQEGPNSKPESNIPLHISVRPKNTEIVRNTLREGRGWDLQEERCGGYPLAPESHFEIQVAATREAFKIFINQKEFACYCHRLPLQSVKFLRVEGDVHLDVVYTE